MTQVKEARVVYQGRARTVPEPITDARNAAAFFRREIGNETREVFAAILLDGRNHPIAFERISVGILTASLIHPREVFRAAVHVGAGSIIVAHNHPSGDPKPSSEDESVTDRLYTVGKLLGIQLLDSLIVCSTREYFSFQEAGRMPQ